MLNNKKSLLQRARIAMVAIVTIMGIGGAFAMNPPQNQALQTWGVLVTNANTYRVTALTDDSFCDKSEQPLKICEVRSAATPDPVTHEIPTSGATILDHGQFNQ